MFKICLSLCFSYDRYDMSSQMGNLENEFNSYKKYAAEQEEIKRRLRLRDQLKILIIENDE